MLSLSTILKSMLVLGLHILPTCFAAYGIWFNEADGFAVCFVLALWWIIALSQWPETSMKEDMIRLTLPQLCLQMTLMHTPVWFILFSGIGSAFSDMPFPDGWVLAGGATTGIWIGYLDLDLLPAAKRAKDEYEVKHWPHRPFNPQPIEEIKASLGAVYMPARQTRIDGEGCWREIEGM